MALSEEDIQGLPCLQGFVALRADRWDGLLAEDGLAQVQPTCSHHGTEQPQADALEKSKSNSRRHDLSSCFGLFTPLPGCRRGALWN